MLFQIILIGLLIGANLFFFTYLITKKNKLVYLSPLVTFLSIPLFLAYGLYVVRGWEGMTFLFISLGILIVSVIGTVLLSFRSRKSIPNNVKKLEKVGVFLLPFLLVSSLLLITYLDKEYWVLEKGVSVASSESYYKTSDLIEGNKQVYIKLSEEYIGKEINIEDVKQG
ncbi:hypothetical protein Pryu01_02079 [Paraliobacillus ryukyuensis]|uniref:YesK-like protein n=1 Tax=Paraliobacillus ryukyuensis TaxID=200904 RepID=A0A366E6Z6_9BACI|nr:hypothetical protein [Paraliobacillus ryukyuensis]RBO97188.1 YesK-like protein [Paraliobacillus ryukyuensis]